MRRQTGRSADSSLRAIDPATYYAKALARAERALIDELTRQAQTEEQRQLETALGVLREHDERLRRRLRDGLREVQQAQGPTEVGQL